MQAIPEDGLVLDIGANLGVMTVHLSRHVRRGRVVAFEPMSENLAVLRRVIGRYGLANVQVEACALGDREGAAEMVLPVEHGARRHGLSHVVHDSIGERNEGLRRSVPMRRLDDFGFAMAPGPAAIKIDVENFEWFVLEGGLATLRAHRPMLYVELWENENRTRCLELLTGLGYEASVCEDGRNFIFRSVGSYGAQ